MFVLSRWSGGLVSRYGARIPLIIGPLIAGRGFFSVFAIVPGERAITGRHFFQQLSCWAWG